MTQRCRGQHGQGVSLAFLSPQLAIDHVAGARASEVQRKSVGRNFNGARVDDDVVLGIDFSDVDVTKGHVPRQGQIDTRRLSRRDINDGHSVGLGHRSCGRRRR